MAKKKTGKITADAIAGESFLYDASKEAKRYGRTPCFNHDDCGGYIIATDENRRTFACSEACGWKSGVALGLPVKKKAKV